MIAGAAAAALLAGCGEDGDRPSGLRSTPPEEGGDEAGNRIPVRIVIGRGGLRASDEVVPAFLTLRLRFVNRLDRRVRVTVAHDGAPVARARVPPEGRETLDVEGRPAGTLVVRSPAGRVAVAVEPGAG